MLEVLKLLQHMQHVLQAYTSNTSYSSYFHLSSTSCQLSSLGFKLVFDFTYSIVFQCFSVFFYAFLQYCCRLFFYRGAGVPIEASGPGISKQFFLYLVVIVSSSESMSYKTHCTLYTMLSDVICEKILLSHAAARFSDFGFCFACHFCHIISCFAACFAMVTVSQLLRSCSSNRSRRSRCRGSRGPPGALASSRNGLPERGERRSPLRSGPERRVHSAAALKPPMKPR